MNNSNGQLKNKIRNVVFMLLVVVFSILQMISMRIQEYNSFIEYNKAVDLAWIYNLAFFFSIFSFSLFMIKGISLVAERLIFTSYNSVSYRNKKLLDFWDKHFFIVSLIGILLGWLPWLIVYYPGSIFYDMTYQIDQYYGVYKIQTHPPFSTLIMGKLMDIGKSFGSDNFGLFLYTVLQTCVCLFACVYSIKTMRRMKVGNKFECMMMLFYSLFPLFGASAQCGQKDTMNYGITLFATVFLINIFISVENNEIKKKDLLGYAVSVFVGALWRKEMIYVYSLCTVFVFIFAVVKKINRQMLVILGLILLAIVLSKPIQNNGIAKGYFGQEFAEGKAEAYSIPLQMVARVLTYDDSFLTDDEKQIIGECFSYDYDEIKTKYNPNLSDPIKYHFNVLLAKENGFWKVFKRIIKMRPKICVESIIASSYGYFYVGPNVPATVNDAPTNGLPGGRLPSCYINRGPDKGHDKVVITYVDGMSKYRSMIYAWMKSFQIPINLLYSFGFYTWLIIFLLFRSIIENGIKEIIPFSIVLFLIAVCIASPVNDYGRYYMGVIYIVPLIIGVARRTKGYGKIRGKT